MSYLKPSDLDFFEVRQRLFLECLSILATAGCPHAAIADEAERLVERVRKNGVTLTERGMLPEDWGKESVSHTAP